MVRTLLLLIGLVLFASCPRPQAAAHAAAPTAATNAAPGAAQLTPAQAQAVLDVLQDPQKRAQFIAVLQDMAKALPAKAAPAGAPPAEAGKAGAAAAPAQPAPTPAPPAATPATPAAPTLEPDGIGAQLVVGARGYLGEVARQLAGSAAAISDFPGLLHWLRRLAASEQGRAQLRDAGLIGLLIVVAGLLAEFLLRWLLRRPRLILEQHAPRRTDVQPAPAMTSAAAEAAVAQAEAELIDPEPPADVSGLALAEAGETEPPRRLARRQAVWMLLRRLPYVLADLVLEVLPLGLFAVVAFLLLGSGLAESMVTRLSVLEVVNAYLVCRALLAVAGAALSPRTPRLRLFALSNQAAGFTLSWLRWLVGIAVVGGAVAQIALIFGLAPAAHDALLRLVSLAVHIGLASMVLQARRPVAARLAGLGGAAANPLRARLVQYWQVPVLVVIALSWLVSAVELRNGVGSLLDFLLWSAVVLALGRLAYIVAVGALDRAFRIGPDTAARFPGLEARAASYHPVLRAIVTSLIGVVTLVALLQVWGADSLRWFARGALGSQLVAAGGSIGLTLALAVVIWEFANAGIQRHLDRLTLESQAARSARVRTLLPMLRSVLLVTIVVIAGLTVLSQIGINIAPLLAGAGIVGVAIGFGSQKLVQDIITGLFLLLENAMQVGDWVTVGGLSGTVEHLSIRTIRLRAGDGSVHIVPFSSVTTVNNTNRGIGNAAVSVEVAISTDIDKAFAVLREVAAGLRREPGFRGKITADLQLWGVDKVGGGAMTIAGQIPCTADGRWSVQREFNRRMKQCFDAEGIAFAVPVQMTVIAPGTPAATDTQGAAAAGAAPNAAPGAVG